jgi:hypothetical protein
VLLAVTVAPSVSLADGGVVRKRAASGPFVITVLTTPEPLRAGPAEVTVLVQARDDEETILDADVELRLTPPSSVGESKVVRAMRGEEASKLLYAAAIELPVAGLVLDRHGARSGGPGRGQLRSPRRAARLHAGADLALPRGAARCDRPLCPPPVAQAAARARKSGGLMDSGRGHLFSLTFPVLRGAVGWSGTFELYAALGVLTFAFVVVKVPETKGKTLEQIGALWR